MKNRERLIIKNFFSITSFDWDIKGFNVLTGGMASGKSIALKLLFFCEQILDKIIFDTPISKGIFHKENFFNKIAENFNEIFISKDNKTDYSFTKIEYKYEFNKIPPKSFGDQSDPQLFDTEISTTEENPECGVNNTIVFDLSAQWDEQTNKLQWSSKYIESKLETWQGFFDKPNTPKLVERVRTHILESLLSDFANTFPFATLFIPASRAIAAIINNIKSRDVFITDFMALKDYALRFNEIGNSSVNKILQFRNITIENEDNKQPVFELLNGRSISSLELSSGQQELLYLLLIIYDLKRTRFNYSNYLSVFIEEPSAHLFPKEQKETIEFIAASFNDLQKNNPGYRFFISTHSPYVLNTVNNILEKGRLSQLADKIDNQELKTAAKANLEQLLFPSLPVENVSAYMIEKGGVVKSMINEDDDEPYIYSEAIEQISQEITTETEKLSDINNSLKKSF